MTDKGPRYIAEPNELQTQILHAMYRSAQRGDSVERMHFDVCAIITASSPNKQLVAALKELRRSMAYGAGFESQQEFWDAVNGVDAALAAAGEVQS